MTMTSTYDHRIIQGAESGRFLAGIEEYLQGEDGSTRSCSARSASRPARTGAARSAAAAPALSEAQITSTGGEKVLQAVQAASRLSERPHTRPPRGAP